MESRKIVATQFIFTLLAAFLGALLMYGTLVGNPPLPSVQAAVTHLAAPINNDVNGLQNAVVQAAALVGPSVVFIDTAGYSQEGEFPGLPEGFGMQNAPTRGQGSGVIVSQDGLILTNDHVVRGASDIQVTLSDKRKFKATLKGADRLSDIALLKIDASGLPAAQLGDSTQAPVGSFVIAVGNPYGMDHTVTMGVLSGRGRHLDEPGKEFRDLLQTDAAINPGNSGGPLVDLRGRVIGINTAIIQQAQGIGFAIPIDTAKTVMQQLASNGKVVRPYIGIVMQPVTEQVARYLQVPNTDGVLVRQVAPNSPAEKAGLDRGDIIVEVDGARIQDPDQFRERIRSHHIGDQVTLKMWRDQQMRTVTLRVEEMPSS